MARTPTYEENGTMRAGTTTDPTSAPAIAAWDTPKAAAVIVLAALGGLMVVRRAFTGARGY